MSIYARIRAVTIVIVLSGGTILILMHETQRSHSGAAVRAARTVQDDNGSQRESPESAPPFPKIPELFPCPNDAEIVDFLTYALKTHMQKNAVISALGEYRDTNCMDYEMDARGPRGTRFVTYCVGLGRLMCFAFDAQDALVYVSSCGCSFRQMRLGDNAEIEVVGWDKK